MMHSKTELMEQNKSYERQDKLQIKYRTKVARLQSYTTKNFVDSGYYPC